MCPGRVSNDLDRTATGSFASRLHEDAAVGGDSDYTGSDWRGQVIEERVFDSWQIVWRLSVLTANSNFRPQSVAYGSPLLGNLKIVAAIPERSVIEKILLHLGL